MTTKYTIKTVLLLAASSEFKLPNQPFLIGENENSLDYKQNDD